MGRLRGLNRCGRLLLAVAAGGAVFGIAAAVQASIPDSNGVIHACYSKSAAPGSQPGALRVIDTALGQTCQISEGAVSWSQIGPTGARGSTGARGPTGPSDSYTNYRSAPFVIVDGGSEKTILTLTLPTGRYTLSASIDGRLKPTPPGPTETAVGFCEYVTAGGATTLHQGPTDWFLSNYDPGDTFKSTFPLLGDITVSSGPTTLNVNCDSVDADDEEADFTGSLVATTTAAVH